MTRRGPPGEKGGAAHAGSFRQRRFDQTDGTLHPRFEPGHRGLELIAPFPRPASVTGDRLLPGARIVVSRRGRKSRHRARAGDGDKTGPAVAGGAGERGLRTIPVSKKYAGVGSLGSTSKGIKARAGSRPRGKGISARMAASMRENPPVN
jgi:hypothetical protein